MWSRSVITGENVDELTGQSSGIVDEVRQYEIMVKESTEEA
jgi:hypothetical protein